MIEQPVAERHEIGRTARATTPRSAHREWASAGGRRDPVTLLEEQNAQRVPFLVPLRHTRMRVSPFTFYRGAARIMASDLASTPSTGIKVQLGGDAHLSNFGAYASPSRELVFDANDFDETLPGPWEWDLKRLATSITVAAQHVGIGAKARRKMTAGTVNAYRSAMARFGKMGMLDLWYDHTTIDDVRARPEWNSPEFRERVTRFEQRARKRNNLRALQKLTVEVDGHYRIRRDPPLLERLVELPDEYRPNDLDGAVRESFEVYRQSVPDELCHLLDQYDIVDVGMKVVGVGSVGTLCLVILLEGRDRHDPLFLQIKEATASVLEEFAGPSKYESHGRRVVEGQKLTQAQNDIFLGWTAGSIGHRHFYVRQLLDWKGSVEIEGQDPIVLDFYARLCGETLARGHARSGDAIAIAAYLGKGKAFDDAVADFAELYAQQNLEDYQAFTAAIDDGRLPVDTVNT
jgi:uncharacterized protein (DUF2252 family)